MESTLVQELLARKSGVQHLGWLTCPSGAREELGTARKVRSRNSLDKGWDFRKLQRR
jgi:hypothetical protein